MKKVLVLVVALFAGVTAQAQDEMADFGFIQGDVFVEGNLGFSSQNDKNSDTKTNAFNISPKVGYFTSEDLALGAELNFGSSSTEVAGTDTADNSTFGAGVFGRYYFLNLGERFKTFAELGLGFGNTNDKLSDVKVNTIGAGLDLGINYFVTEKIALSFGLKNVLSFSSSKVDVDGAEAVSNFNLGFGDVANPFGGNAAFGILFVL